MRISIAGLVLLAVSLPIQSADPPKRAKDLFGDPLPEGAVLRLGTTRLRATIQSFGILADGTVVTIGPGNAVTTWELKDDEGDVPIPIPLAGPAGQAYPQVSPDGRYVASNTRIQVAVWERPIDQIRQVATFDVDQPRYLLFSPDGSKLAVTNTTERAERMSLCDVKTGKVMELAGEPNYFEGITFSGDGKLLVGISGYEAFAWDVATGKNLAQYKTGKVRYDAIALNPGGDLMAVAPTWGEKIVFVDPLTGKPVDGFISPARGSWVTFAPDGKTLLIGDLTGVTWWDHVAGKVVRRFEGMAHSGYGGPHPVARFTPDGKTLVATSGQVLLRWSTATGEPLFRAALEGGHQYEAWAVGASADGKWYATGGHDGKTRLWDAASGKTVRSFPARWMNEKNVEFSTDGRFLFCPDADHKTVVKWNVATGEEVMRFAHKKDTPTLGGLCAYRLTVDGKTVVAASSAERRDGVVMVAWDADTGAVSEVDH